MDSAIQEFKPDRMTSMDDWIQEGDRLLFSNKRFSFLEKLDVEGITLISSSLVSKYYDMLNKFIISIQLTPEQLAKYKFQPKLFSQDFYGTPELWSFILYINNMVSISEFNKRTIKTFTYDIIDILDELYTINESDLVQNRARIGLSY